MILIGQPTHTHTCTWQFYFGDQKMTHEALHLTLTLHSLASLNSGIGCLFRYNDVEHIVIILCLEMLLYSP